MACDTEYDELMSLKLDALLDSQEETRLDEHLKSCADCGPLWAAMQQMNEILCASALEPLPVPSDFHAKVMVRIAVSAPAAVLAPGPVYVPATAPNVVMVTPSLTRRLGELPTAYLAGYAEWQKRTAQYLRGMAAVGLSIAGTVGLLLALMLSGTIKLSGPAADAVGTVRTFFQAIDTWIRSLFVGFGPGLAAIGVLLVGILLLVGWQVVNGYHRTAMENRGSTGVLEALA
ncbi:MAG: zf-HC2 domain-containing protein [Chloroflexota bacterium]